MKLKYLSSRLFFSYFIGILKSKRCTLNVKYVFYNIVVFFWTTHSRSNCWQTDVCAHIKYINELVINWAWNRNKFWAHHKCMRIRISQWLTSHFGRQSYTWMCVNWYTRRSSSIFCQKKKSFTPDFKSLKKMKQMIFIFHFENITPTSNDEHMYKWHSIYMLISYS